MAPKKNAREAVASASTTSTTTAAPPVASQSKSKTGAADWDKVLMNIYDYYLAETPQRTKLLDAFLAFLAVVGALQFLYCILAGNYVRLSWRRRPGGGAIHDQC